MCVKREMDPKFQAENDRLVAAYLKQDELDVDEFFEKYQSKEFKEYIEKTVKEAEEEYQQLMQED